MESAPPPSMEQKTYVDAVRRACSGGGGHDAQRVLFLRSESECGKFGPEQDTGTRRGPEGPRYNGPQQAAWREWRLTHRRGLQAEGSRRQRSVVLLVMDYECGMGKGLVTHKHRSSIMSSTCISSNHRLTPFFLQ
jgi:hypothetical protein